MMRPPFLLEGQKSVVALRDGVMLFDCHATPSSSRKATVSTNVLLATYVPAQLLEHEVSNFFRIM
jgi:hypothetical protein